MTAATQKSYIGMGMEGSIARWYEKTTRRDMGEFRKGDVGLTNGTVNTQLPFQASQLPQLPNTGSTAVCPLASDGSPWTNSNVSCDEIHEIALLAYDSLDLAFIWPVNESVQEYRGAVATTSNGFNLTLSRGFDPCNAADPGVNCTGMNPLYPGAGAGVAGAAMAIASDTSGAASLWAIVPNPGVGGTWGWLYAYSLDPRTWDLIHQWDSGTGMGNCGNTSANGWVATAFTEPTLANGAAYVPTACVVTGTSTGYLNCGQVPAANIASGILVFSACQ